ncbi:MAG: efflux RND transporter periplasmic adaptor subunit, partial [Chlorobi bacterium]|nr:efflux RND transporter periplasmic adaptor subunit [Chlorobiota bacterium]
MKNATIIFGILVVMAASLVLSSCGHSNAEPDTNAVVKKQVQPIAVKVTELQPAPYGKEFVVMGIAKAYEDIMLSPEEGGVVKEWKYPKGSYVPKNAIVVVLKDEILKAGYEAALAQYKLAELNYEKQKSVYEEQAVSELQFKNAQYNYESAKAAMELAKARLERTRLRAPVAGYLDQRMADAGEMAPPGVPVARIVDASRLRIQGEVPERYAPEVHPGTRVRVVFDALPGDTISGRISYVGASISSSNRSLPVEVVVSNPEKKIKPEMVGKMYISI